MHEAGQIRGVIHHLEALAVEHGCNRIVAVKLSIRDRGDYSADHYRDHLQVLCPGTVLADAEFDIDVVADPLHAGPPQFTIESIEVPD